MTANMYRVGDYVYFEISSSSPFQIRRIEELNKTPSGQVEAKVMCFYRRRDISPTLLKIADKNQGTKGISVSLEDDKCKLKMPAKEPSPPIDDGDVKLEIVEHSTTNGMDHDKENKEKEDVESGPTIKLLDMDQLGCGERHQLKHRELFLSRQIETLPATHIRGKCTVTLLNERETPDSYMGKEDSFFYSLVYDPTQKTLLADKGEIRIGDKYQAQVQALLSPEDLVNDRLNGTYLETRVFHPHHPLTDRDIDQFLIVARAVGTFSRALDTSSSVKLPSLHMTAAAASRDVTLFHAMALLHHANYDLGLAMKYLVPPPCKQDYPLEADRTTGHHTVSLGGPILCRDQMEEWSAAEANLFEEALEKYGKDFNDIRQDFLPWKSLKDIVEYYYMWKTTDRYVQQKRVKAMEAESRLKQVYIPNYNKANPNLIQAHTGFKFRSCESCKSEDSLQWYTWGPSHLQLRVCQDCWNYWKKHGGLKNYHEYESYDKSAQRTNGDVTGMQLNGPPGLMVQRPAHFINNMPQQQRHMHITGIQGQRGHVSGPGYPVSQSSMLSNIGMVPTRMGVPGGPKPRAPFFMQTTWITRIGRRLAPKDILRARRAARNPFHALSMQAVKQHCSRIPNQILEKTYRVICGSRPPPPPDRPAPRPTEQSQLKRPAVVQNGNGVIIEDGINEPLNKKPRIQPTHSAGRMYFAWTETSEDAIFKADKNTKSLRRLLNKLQLKQVARKPWLKGGKGNLDELLPPAPPTPLIQIKSNPCPVKLKLA